MALMDSVSEVQPKTLDSCGGQHVTDRYSAAVPGVAHDRDRIPRVGATTTTPFARYRRRHTEHPLLKVVLTKRLKRLSDRQLRRRRQDSSSESDEDSENDDTEDDTTLSSADREQRLRQLEERLSRAEMKVRKAVERADMWRAIAAYRNRKAKESEAEWARLRAALDAMATPPPTPTPQPSGGHNPR